MRRTRALPAAIALLAAIVLLEKPCLAQDAQNRDAQNYAVAAPDPVSVQTPQAPALSPGPSLAWAKTHLPSEDATESAQRAAAITERVIQINQRRYCVIVYLAAVIYESSSVPQPAADDNSFVNPCG